MEGVIRFLPRDEVVGADTTARPWRPKRTILSLSMQCSNPTPSSLLWVSGKSVKATITSRLLFFLAPNHGAMSDRHNEENHITNHSGPDTVTKKDFFEQEEPLQATSSLPLALSK